MNWTNFELNEFDCTELLLGLPSSVVVHTVASQQKGSWFKSWLGPFCVEFACSTPWVLSGYRLVFWKSVEHHRFFLMFLLPFLSSFCRVQFCYLRRVLLAYRERMAGLQKCSNWWQVSKSHPCEYSMQGLYCNKKSSVFHFFIQICTDIDCALTFFFFCSGRRWYKNTTVVMPRQANTNYWNMNKEFTGN